LPYVPVPKDLTKVKTKLVFNLTKRQLVCFGLGGVIGVPVYLFSRASIGNETAAVLMIGLMLPFFAFGIYEKDGQPLEKVLMNFVGAVFLRPQVRPYRTDNGYAALVRQAEINKEAERIEKEREGKKQGKGGPDKKDIVGAKDSAGKA